MSRVLSVLENLKAHQALQSAENDRREVQAKALAIYPVLRELYLSRKKYLPLWCVRADFQRDEGLFTPRYACYVVIAAVQSKLLERSWFDRAQTILRSLKSK